MNNIYCSTESGHLWVEVHREPTGPVISSLMTEPTEYKECSYIQHEYCSICRQTRKVQMPSGSVYADREIKKVAK